MDINMEGFDFSNPGRKRKSCTLCGSIEHTKPTCPNKPCSHCNEIGHLSNACPVAKALAKEKDNARKLAENISSREQN